MNSQPQGEASPQIQIEAGPSRVVPFSLKAVAGGSGHNIGTIPARLLLLGRGGVREDRDKSV